MDGDVTRWTRRVPDSGGAIGEQNGDTVDDGIAAIASGAAHAGRVEREGFTADGAGEEREVVLFEGGHKDKVQGSRFELRGTMGAG